MVKSKIAPHVSVRPAHHAVPKGKFRIQTLASAHAHRSRVLVDRCRIPIHAFVPAPIPVRVNWNRIQHHVNALVQTVHAQTGNVETRQHVIACVKIHVKSHRYRTPAHVPVHAQIHAHLVHKVRIKQRVLVPAQIHARMGRLETR